MLLKQFYSSHQRYVVYKSYRSSSGARRNINNVLLLLLYELTFRGDRDSPLQVDVALRNLCVNGADYCTITEDRKSYCIQYHNTHNANHQAQYTLPTPTRRTVESRRVGGVYTNSQLVGDSFVVSSV